MSSLLAVIPIFLPLTVPGLPRGNPESAARAVLRIDGVLSTIPISAAVAGTKLPICAIRHAARPCYRAGVMPAGSVVNIASAALSMIAIEIERLSARALFDILPLLGNLGKNRANTMVQLELFIFAQVPFIRHVQCTECNTHTVQCQRGKHAAQIAVYTQATPVNGIGPD